MKWNPTTEFQVVINDPSAYLRMFLKVLPIKGLLRDAPLLPQRRWFVKWMWVQRELKAQSLRSSCCWELRVCERVPEEGVFKVWSRREPEEGLTRGQGPSFTLFPGRGRWLGWMGNKWALLPETSPFEHQSCTHEWIWTHTHTHTPHILQHTDF